MPSIQPRRTRRAGDFPAVKFEPFTWVPGPDQAPGGSPDAQTLRQRLANVLEHYWDPASRQMETVPQKFARLAKEWKEETKFLSSLPQMCMHPAYQQIIGMGQLALPLLLRELVRERDHWFWALHAITGVNPVSPASSGDVDAMAEAWIRWGYEQRWI